MAVVLIVDDMEANRELARAVLDQHGYQAITADDGAAALDMIHRRPPDVVVTDVLMPGMDGYQLVQALRADPATLGLPVIFYTANYLEEEARPIATAFGVSRIVAKTGDTRPLVDAVSAALTEPAMRGIGFAGEDFNREHMRILNSKLIQQLHELEEQNRLRELANAAISVSSDLSLSATLQRIVDASRSLLDARYAVLRVSSGSGDENRSGDFIVAGLSPDESRPIGSPVEDPPTLTLPTREQAPLRLADLSAEESPPGSAAHRLRQQHASLSVPIVVDEALFGNLYLVEKNVEQAFTPSDESILVELAAAGGIAISNALRYDDARRKQEWLSASAEITSTLLGTNPAEPLELVARGARRVAGADVAWIEVPTQHQTVVVSAADGLGEDELRGTVLSLAEAELFAQVSASGRPEVINDAMLDGRLGAFTAIERGSLMAVPLTAADRCLGALLIGNERGHGHFSALDLEMATTFAGHAALVIEFAAAQEDRHRLGLLEERDRIARDLHDRVIQTIFATGLGIQGVAGQLGRGAAADRLAGYVADIDKIISQLRSSIYQLHSPSKNPAGTLHAQLLDAIDSTGAAIGLAPDIRFTGGADVLLPDEIVADLVAAAGETLIIIGRHAEATSAGITLDIGADQVTLQISADGKAFAESPIDGLDGIRARAMRHGGAFEITTPADGGTALSWSALLPPR